MLLENYCYSQPVMQIGNMARKGVFGELTYAECAYIHDLRAMRFDAAGQLTWRGRSLADISGNLYPTHAAGPVCQWLGVNRSDRLVSLVALASKAAATHEYAVAKFGKDHAAAGIQFRNGDTTNALIRTERGRLIQIRYDGSSPRPSGMGEYALQGTRGAYESAFGLQKVYLEGRSPEHAWEPLEKYQREFEHPYWAERGEEARRAGHGGGDFFVISDFLAAIRGGASPIDVVDAVTWSAIRPLSALSLERGGSAVEFPDFRQSPRP
jgi:predicted dehydrogenase